MIKKTYNESHDERWQYKFLKDVLRWLESHESEYRNARIQNSGIALYDTYENRELEFHSLRDLKNWLGY